MHYSNLVGINAVSLMYSQTFYFLDDNCVSAKYTNSNNIHYLVLIIIVCIFTNCCFACRFMIIIISSNEFTETQ